MYIWGKESGMGAAERKEVEDKIKQAYRGRSPTPKRRKRRCERDLSGTKTLQQ